MARVQEAEVIELGEVAARPGELERRNRLHGRLLDRARSYPRDVWLLTLANTVLWTGRGMSMPFLFIFFSDVAGLSSSLVGAGIALSVVLASLFVLAVAGQIDLRGGQPILLAAITGVALLTLAYGWAITPATFLLATVVLFTADQLYWPAVNSTLVPLIEPARVAEGLALLRCAYILGIGLGGLVGGVMVAGGGLDEYRLMWVISAGIVGLAAVLIWRLVPAVKLPSRDAHGLPGTWRAVLADRLNLAVLGVMFVVIFGYCQLQLSIPAFLKQEAAIDEGTIGALILLKTIITLGLQLPVAARISYGNLGRLLAVAAGFFLSGLLAVALAPEIGVPAAALVFLLFTAGELLFAPITSVAPVRLAPDHLRGRYFAAQSVVWGAAWGLSSFAAGLALDSPRPVLLWPLLAGLMVVGALWSWRLRNERRLAPPGAGPIP
jgi:predicted MFS family arabinose efflux permease